VWPEPTTRDEPRRPGQSGQRQPRRQRDGHRNGEHEAEVEGRAIIQAIVRVSVDHAEAGRKDEEGHRDDGGLRRPPFTTSVGY